MTLTELFDERNLHPRSPVTISADGGPVDVATLDLDTGRYLRVSPPSAGHVASRALVLLRSGGWPVGLEELDLIDGLPSGAISTQLGHEVLASRSRSATGVRPLSVVVCTRNRPTLLDSCLARLVPLLGDDDELIVVDNAPQDSHTAAVVAKYGSKARHVVEPWPGLSNARNCGLQAVTNAFVVFTHRFITAFANFFRTASRPYCIILWPGKLCV